MTPKRQLWIELRRRIIERDGEAPIVVAEISEFHVTRMKPLGGRPKATAKHAAVVMAFQLEFLRNGNKPFKAGVAVARQFGYGLEHGERKVRGIINSKQNPLRGASGFIWTGDGSEALVIMTESHDAVVVKQTAIHIDGRGWFWRPGMTEAGHGKLRVSGQLKEATEGALSPGGDMGQNPHV